jgi:hypothetical protein
MAIEKRVERRDKLVTMKDGKFVPNDLSRAEKSHLEFIPPQIQQTTKRRNPV